MDLSETFRVAAIIEKLPLTQKDFKSWLKHKRKEMNLEDHIIKPQIKEGDENNDKKKYHFCGYGQCFGIQSK